MGRRERKKAATHKALADAALELFLERGYEDVGVREIAEAADVSVTTLFKHFPDGKVALLFDKDDEREAGLRAAVRDRPAGQSVIEALRREVAGDRVDRYRATPRFAQFMDLINSTPALRDYTRRMWLRHEAALAEEIAVAAGLPEDDAACAALAHFALEAGILAHARPDHEEALERIFDLLENGWKSVTGEG
ncbi:TetR family transcriptional regulator [Actinomadura barringtoniae]|uniref:TetR family transcriptional regulator n=2 Tax=Actinomadura barringtoniae TaxID=1427535 RepID=A0A939PKN8_9ACTN|nr:TetR family transcriptional regulator [Actinomadura barringtoniae]